MANLATKAAVEGSPIKIHTPLIDKSKADIIRLGVDATMGTSVEYTAEREPQVSKYSLENPSTKKMAINLPHIW